MGERRGMKGLELWCRKVTEGYPGVKIDNMTTSWRDGLAFCAMIHHFRPDLIDFDKLNKEDIYHNNELAFRVAEHHLEIPALLEAEDMVEFEVPDRLSILTYLSQFYQTFEVARGKSGPRVAAKRPTSTPDHGIVSPASTSPPTKVLASTSSRVRREPCAKCKLPVFIAERLNIGKLLYHRTCFKCARCKSQLALANYYETESGEFCCEVCPDEEHFQNLKSDESSVLQRSLSDEEKSASLRKYDAYSTQFESALESPTDKELKKNFTLSQSDSKARMSFFQSQLEDKQSKLQDQAFSSSVESLSDEIPPDLPKSVPPYVDSGFPEHSSSKNTQHLENKDSFSVNKSKNFVTKDVDSPNSVKARLRLFEKLDSKEKSEKVHLVNISSRNSPEKAGSAKVINLSDLEDFDNISKKETDSDGVSIKSERRSASVEKCDISSEIRLDNENNKLDKSREEIDNHIRNNASEIPSKIESIKVSKDQSETSANISDISSINIPKLKVSKVETSNAMKKDEGLVNQTTKRFSSSKHIDLKFGISNDFSNLDKSGQATDHFPLEICDSSQENSIFSKESDSGNISFEKEDSVIEILDSEKEDSVIKILDSSEESSNKSKPANVEILDSTQECEQSTNGSDMGQINNESSLPVVTVSDDSYFSAKEGVSGLETTVATQAFTTAREILPSTEFTSPSYSEKNLQNVLENNLKEVESSIVFDRDLDSNENVQIAEAGEEKIDNDYQISVSENIKEDLAEAVNFVLKDAKENVIEDTDTSTKMVKLKQNKTIDYPEDMNPFGDEEDEKEEDAPSNASLNPFGDDTDGEEEPALRPHLQIPTAVSRKKKIPKDDDSIGQRIYVERISYNPFEDKPATSPRQRRKIIPKEKMSLTPIGYKEEEDEEEKIVPVPKPRHLRTSSIPSNSLATPYTSHTLSPSSRSSYGGSTSSISSGSAFGSARKKKPAPRPPLPNFNSNLVETASPSTISLTSSISSSVSPRSHGKTKRAPPPPSFISTPYPPTNQKSQTLTVFERGHNRLSFGLGVSPINFDNDKAVQHEENKDNSFESVQLHDKVETDKSSKDEENRNRQSLENSGSTYKLDTSEIDRIINNKSNHGKWKRQKGKAPSRPIPERRIIKSLPLSEIRRELDSIEIQQQGLEKQGVRLEQIIRDKCEGDGEDGIIPDDSIPIDVEDLILQLFELVNEKNELFRRQAELMYLRRQQRLEEEHADVEYQIRCIMMQPEANKTDSDKAREEALINRLVEIVERRNEIIECLEMDRIRETEEDDSISSQLNLYSQKRENEKDSIDFDDKKHKKDIKRKFKKIKLPFHIHKHKEKGQKVELDKDVDTTEVNTNTLEKKKKKKFNLF